jgi:alkylmercury lyase
MGESHLDELTTTWDFENNGIPPEESTLAAKLEILMYRTLADGNSVSAAGLASAADVPVEIIRTLFEQGKKQGGEWDDEGRLLGDVISLVPTRHHFNVNGKRLYTWCSLDAIHLPGILGQTAEVESTDPVNGEKINLTIPPDGVPAYDPPGTVLSIVLSGGDRSGPQSPLGS